MKLIYKKTFRRALLSTFIVLFSLVSFSATYYVSSAGNDSNSGLSSSLAWKSLAKVNSTTLNAGDQVLFQKGDTFYGSLTFNHSGSSSSRIVYGAYGTGNKPVITGFSNVTDWTNLGGNIWESQSAVTTLPTLDMVAINGVNTGMGRTPNTGYYYYQSHSDDFHITSDNLSGTPNWTGAELAFSSVAYITQRVPITSQSGSTLGFTQPEQFNIYSTGDQFIIQNDPRTLDVQNEWYFNPSTKKLRIYSASTPTNVQVATINNLVTINAGYITIDNISIVGSNAKAITVGGHDYVTIQNCDIRFIGNNAVHGSYTSSNHLTVEGCTISDSNNGGIGVTRFFTDVTIRSNKITNMGVHYGATQRIFGGGDDNNSGRGYGISVQGTNSLVELNTIENTGYIGIMTYGANNQIIQKNFVKNFCLTTHDGGGIYTWNGTPPVATNSGIKILNNIVIGTMADGVSSDNDADAGIYLDDYSNGVEISGNTLSGGEYGIFLHEAWNVVIQNNTTFDNDKGIRVYGEASPFCMTNISVQNNIVVAKGAGQIAMHLDPMEMILPTFSASNNLYARPISEGKTVGGYNRTPSFSFLLNTISEWQAYTGKDANCAKSPQTVSNESDMRFEYNETNATKTVSLSQPMMDMKGVKYNGSITLQPFKSMVLIKDITTSVVPGAPTTVVATAGNASATLTFVAPVSNGGSTISGYTLTSNPAGGVDANAGSSSLTRTITGLTNGTSYTFTVKAANSVGSSVASAPSNSVIPKAPTAVTASSFTVTGPSSVNVNNTSTNFTITPNNTYTGTITLTPSGAGSAGLTSKVLTFANSSAAQTFSITPTVAGSITLTPTNNGSLTNPANLTCTAKAMAPGAPTSVVATAGNASATLTFVAPVSNGGSTITGYSLTSNPAGGVDTNAGSSSLTRTITGLTNGTAYTFTVKATNSAGTSVASVASNSVIPKAPVSVASAFTFTGPSSGNVNSTSSTFRVTPSSLFTGTITITPTGTGSVGLSAKVLTFSNSSTAQSFTITSTVAGNITLSATNNGGLTNPASLNYSSNAVAPGAPTLVVATAGDANATITFVAPTYNGGSAITGYTVTSNPAGGTDMNAGSTSQTHTISGLTNGIAYTFTVIATNSAGSSWASAVSNSVTPGSTLEATPPTVTAFSIPSTSSSRIVPIYRFTASDNIKVTGYLITETSSTPSPRAKGWTKYVPFVYVSSSSGSKTLYAWAKDGEGNVSASRSDEVKISNRYTSFNYGNKLKNGQTEDIISEQNNGQIFQINVFPNPSVGKVTVRFSTQPDAGSRIDILDISGRKVASRIITELSEEFDLDHQPAGIYLVKTIIGSNETTNKLIIK